MRGPICLLFATFASPVWAEDKSPFPSDLQGEEKLVFASTKNGSWTGYAIRRDAREFCNNSFSCAMVTKDATLVQHRAQESGQLSASWGFFANSRDDLQIELSGISVGERSFEMTSLPWRLLGPVAEDEVVLSFDLQMLAFRRDRNHQWLPISYLTDEMLEAGSFAVTYTFTSGNEYKDDEPVRKAAKRVFKLDGFKEVSKWCGKMLLTDRTAENERIRDLVD